MNARENKIKQILDEITFHLDYQILPFWNRYVLDETYGGYFTTINGEGFRNDNIRKNIVSQSRLIWCYSTLFEKYKKKQYLDMAKHGVDFLITHFLDQKHGGWYWELHRNGQPYDKGKIVYGLGFVIYALSEYTIACKDPIGLEYAEETFDLIQKYAADTLNGGYFEYFEEDWSSSPAGKPGGDRKTLDTHMHLLEAFTNLYKCSGKEIHRKKLNEVIKLVLSRMVNKANGYGMNQFDDAFTSIPAINIERTWNADRETGQTIDQPTQTTSYGHNLELIWLTNKATDLMNIPRTNNSNLFKRVVEHTIAFGLDSEFGGVFRDGPFEGNAIVTDKEWWQNCEALVGFLDTFETYEDHRYLDAFIQTWDFAKKYFIDSEYGEWRQLLNKEGKIIIGDLGNKWKVFYHSGRSMIECIIRIEFLLKNDKI